METPFEKPPVESQEGKTIPISADSLRNPTVSMDRNKSGEYATCFITIRYIEYNL